MGTPKVDAILMDVGEQPLMVVALVVARLKKFLEGLMFSWQRHLAN